MAHMLSHKQNYNNKLQAGFGVFTAVKAEVIVFLIVAPTNQKTMTSLNDAFIFR